MAQTSRILIAILFAALIAMTVLFLMCRGDKAEVSAELKKCRDDIANGVSSGATAEPKFELLVENDAFGVFQPLNNQTSPSENPAYEGGVFFQLGDFFDTEQGYQAIRLYHDDVEVKAFGRGELRWIDITCGDSDSPLSVEAAKTFVPDSGDEATFHRVLHDQMHYRHFPDALRMPVTLVTFWAPEAGIQGSIMPWGIVDAGDHTHGHLEYRWASGKECNVRVWTDWSTSLDYLLDGETVNRIEVTDSGHSTTHGGPHLPPWGFNQG